MTDHQQPTAEHGSVWPPQQQAAPSKKPRLRLILIGLALLVAVIGATVGVTLAMQSDPATPVAPGRSAWEREQQGAVDDETLPDPTAPAVESTPAGHIITASDMELKTKVIDKECFGSAGCNLVVQVLADRKDGVPKPNPDDVFLVTYEITGVDDGPVIGSFEITDGQYTVNEESLGTKSSRSKVKIKVTSVDKVGV